MSELSSFLYRTKISIPDACEELGIEYNKDDLEDLSSCTHCGIWYWEYELIPDLDENNICKFCSQYYGM